MVDPQSSIDMRPRLAFRVGVTGSRHLDAADLHRLRPAVDAVLHRIREALAGLAQGPQAGAVYRHRPDAAPDVELRLLSPLAEGADRLVAEAALGSGYELYAPLPFAQADYEQDFPATVQEFRALAARARIFALDGARGAFETASYEAVGRFVVRNCDILIALWDGEIARGRGGTAEIVHFAASADVPTWWIDTQTGLAKFIATRAQGKDPRLGFEGTAAEAALSASLSSIILPPPAPHPDRHGIMGRAAHHFCRAQGRDTAPLLVFLQEPPPLPTRGLWRAYGLMLDLLAPKPAAPPRPEPAAGAATPAETWWRGLYDRTDTLSMGYADRYRSSYVLIIALAFLALAAAAVGDQLVPTPSTPWAALPTVLELALLCGIGTLVWENHVRGWQERWITYRLLAELCRKQIMLASLGRALPGAEVNRSAAEAAADHVSTRLPREAWVGWYFLAAQRCAPLPQGTMDAAKPRAFALGRALVSEQAGYHQARRHRCRIAEHRLVALSEIFFIITAAGLLLRLGFFAEHAFVGAGEPLERLAILMSGASAAFVGLRAYTEFALLARQSLRMQDVMTQAGAELDALDLGRPLSSLDLGAVLHRLAMAMMQEVAGWAQLFRLKSVETS